MKRWKLLTLTGLGSGVFVASVGVGIIVPIIIKLKGALNNFVPNHQKPFHNLRDKANTTGINYVALGDSEAAGYNGYMGEDYLSYADFLASDMSKANVLHSYKNFAVSGALIADTHKEITRTPAIMSALKTSDLITITIGANDLLSYLRLFEAQFGLSIGSMLGLPSIPYNTNRNSLDPSGNPNDPISIDKRWNLINKSLVEGSKMFKTNNFAGLVSLQPTLVDDIYKMIERDLTFLLADIGKIAPNADVIVTSHAYPFGNFPASMRGYIPSDGFTMTQAYTRFKNTLKSAADLSPNSRFVNFDDIPEYKNDKTPAPALPGLPYTTDTKSPWFRYEKMPNIADIHPSTYGHQLIGNGLFHMFAPYLFNINNYNAYYTLSNTAPGPWKPNESSKKDGVPLQFYRYDETSYAKTSANVIGIEALKENKTQNMFSELFNALNAPTNKALPGTGNTTAYTLNWNDTSKVLTTTKDGPYVAPTNALTKVITGLFGSAKITDLPSILSQLQNPNLSDLLSSILGLVSSAMNTKNEPGNTSGETPFSFMKTAMTTYRKNTLFTGDQFANAKTFFSTNIKDNQQQTINYQNNLKQWGVPNIKTEFGVDNFGEFLQKYNATVTFNSIAKEGSQMGLLVQLTKNPSLSWNNGGYIIDKLKSMGLDSLSKTASAGIANIRSIANKDVVNINKLKKDSKAYMIAINAINKSINEVNGTNIKEPKNNLWTKFSESPRVDVVPILKKAIDKIKTNSKIWVALNKELGYTNIAEQVKNYDTEFSSIKTMTIKNLQNAVQDQNLSDNIYSTSTGQDLLKTLFVTPLNDFFSDVVGDPVS